MKKGSAALFRAKNSGFQARDETNLRARKRGPWSLDRGNLFIPLIIAISLASFLVIRTYLSSQIKPIPTTNYSNEKYSDWKTYNNPTYGFKIKYPRNWFVEEFSTYAANFYDQDPKEATPGSIKARFLKSEEKSDVTEFERISKLENGKKLYEPIDVLSIITKIKNWEIVGNQAIEYEVNRDFSALEGPRKDYSHVYEINRLGLSANKQSSSSNKSGVILQFISTGTTKDYQQKYDMVFQQMISTIKFYDQPT